MMNRFFGYGRTAALLIAFALSPRPAHAQADTIGPPSALFTYRDLVLAGSVAVVTMAARSFDDRMAARLQDSSTQANRKLQGTATFVRTVAAPGAYWIGGTMYLAGRLSKNERLADLGWHGTEALIVGEVVAVIIKGTNGPATPVRASAQLNSYGLFRGFGGGNRFRSFPSGHATSAFAAAAAVSSRPRAGGRRRAGSSVPSSTPVPRSPASRGCTTIGTGPATSSSAPASVPSPASRSYVITTRTPAPARRVDAHRLARSHGRGGHTVRWSIMPAPACSPRIPPAAETPHRAPRTRVTRAKSGIFVIAPIGGDVGARIAELQRQYDPRLGALGQAPHVTLVGSSGMGPIAPDTTREELSRAARAHRRGHPADRPPLRPADALHADTDRRAPARPARPPPHPARAPQDGGLPRGAPALLLHAARDAQPPSRAATRRLASLLRERFDEPVTIDSLEAHLTKDTGESRELVRVSLREGVTQ